MVNAISDTNFQDYQNLLTMLQEQKSQQSSSSENSSGSDSGIVIAENNSSGYIQCMDSNEDGAVTMDEFDSYCEENGMSDSEKADLMEMIMTARVAEQQSQETPASTPEDVANQALIKSCANFADMISKKAYEAYSTTMSAT